MPRLKCVYRLIFLMLIVVNGVSSVVGAAPDKASVEACLMDRSCSAWPNSTLLEVEKELGLNMPIAMKSPTLTDPLWWFVYDYQGWVLELGTNAEEPALTLTTAKRETFYYTGYFKLHTPEEFAAADPHSTYRIPTVGRSFPNTYASFLETYDMRSPITIKDLEMALGLSEPVNVENPAFIDPMWKFFYRTSNDTLSCIIRLCGTSLDDEMDSSVAQEHREAFLFTGYWVVGCSKPEPTPKPTPACFFERVKKYFFDDIGR